MPSHCSIVIERVQAAAFCFCPCFELLNCSAGYDRPSVIKVLSSDLAAWIDDPTTQLSIGSNTTLNLTIASDYQRSTSLCTCQYFPHFGGADTMDTLSLSWLSCECRNVYLSQRTG